MEAQSVEQTARKWRRVDMTDTVHGRLVVVDLHDKTADGSRRWLCACECGGVRIATTGALNAGHAKSCGCLRREPRQGQHLHRPGVQAKVSATRIAKRGPRFEADRQRTWGRLQPLESFDRNGMEWWRCACSCGTACEVRAPDVRFGRQRSCGCLRRETLQRMKDRTTTEIEGWRANQAARKARKEAACNA